ncbi:MAG: response regulator transcription factor [Alphaproteobacteria bacterium]
MDDIRNTQANITNYTSKFGKDFHAHFEKLGLALFSYFLIWDKKPTYETAYWAKDERATDKYFENKLDHHVLSKDFFARGEGRVFIPWIGTNDNPLIEMLKGCGWANGMSVYQQFEDYIVAFHFAADTDHTSVYKLFLNERYLLDQFLLHFYCEKDRLLRVGLDIPKLRFQDGYTPNFDDYVAPKKDLSLYQTLPSKLPLTYNGQKNYMTIKSVKALGLLAKGRSVKEAAIELGISPRTVESHIEAIRKKYKLKSKYQVITLWEECRMLHSLVD